MGDEYLWVGELELTQEKLKSLARGGWRPTGEERADIETKEVLVLFSRQHYNMMPD